MVDTWGFEPLTPACRAGIFPIKLSAHKIKTADAHHNCGIFGSTLFKLTYLSEAMSISKFTKTAGLAVAVGLTVLATNLNILFLLLLKLIFNCPLRNDLYETFIHLTTLITPHIHTY